jgi:uncharacterized protein (DUF486 family)
MPVIVQTVALLVLSNIFMTFAWYAHLRDLNHKPWFIAAAVSWGIAFFEYLIQVPANRIGHTQLNLGQLKIIQEVITLTVFVPFSLWYMKQPFRWDYVWAALCIGGAVFFVFRGPVNDSRSARASLGTEMQNTPGASEAVQLPPR